MTVMTSTTVSGMTVGGGRIFIYEDCVHQCCLIAADEVEYDWQVAFCPYGCLHICTFSGGYRNVVMDVECCRHEGQRSDL